MMFRIGIVDLDTSHPAAWVPIVRRFSGVDVTGVYDSATVYDPGYAQEFAATHGIREVYSSITEMVSHVDGALILGCNWDLHLEQIQPFVEAGKPVFIDKPVVGSVAHIRRLEELVRQGADIIGGSGSVFAPQIEDLRARVSPEDIYTMMATCPHHEFYYGIHTYELIASLMGSDIISVFHLGGTAPGLFRLRYPGDRQAILQLQTPVGRSRIIVSHTQGVEGLDLARKDPYGPVVKRIVDHFTGKEAYPISIESVLQCCRAGIAGKLSMESGEETFLDQLHDDTGYDGYAFAKEYREQQRRRLEEKP